MEMVVSLARKKEIDVNSDLKKQEIRSDQVVMIKKIPMDMSKDMIIAAISEFGEIKSIKIQLMGMDQFRALLFTLSVGMTAHDLGTLLKKADGKTCVINKSLGTGNRIYCTIVGFESDNNLEFTFCTKLILGGIRLSWTRMDLIWCERCRKFGHSALEYNVSVATSSKSLKKPFIKVVSDEHHLQLAKLYEKKSVPISCSAAFGGKSWAQVVSLAGSSDGFHFASGSGSSLSDTSGLNNSILPVLQHGIGATSFNSPSKVLATLIAAKEDLVVDIVMNDSGLVLSSLSFASPSILTLGLSSSKVLTTKVGCLKSKLVAFKISIGSVLVKLELICAGLSLLIATCNIWGINVSAKQKNVVCWHKKSGNIVSIIMKTKLRSNIRPWIANKFNGVRIFLTGLDKSFLGTEIAIIMDNNLAHHVCKIEEISGWIILVRLLFKGKLSVSILDLYASAVNSSTFLVIGGNFNKNSSRRSICFRFCSDLGLVNSLSGSSLVKALIWSNSRGVEKTIDFVFISASLTSMITRCAVSSVSEFFESDYKVVSVSVGLGGLCSSSEFQLRSVDFDIAKKDVFSKFWFNDFECSKNKVFSKFFKLELLISKLVKDLSLHWNLEASIFHTMVNNGAGCDAILGYLSSVKKRYHRSKYFEFRNARDAAIRKVSFCKVVLNHLMVDNNLVLEPSKVKSTVDTIMEGWMKKHTIPDVLSARWAAQYALLSYVDDNAFSKVMCNIGSNEFFQVVKCLPNGKAAGFGLLNILNVCLVLSAVSVHWRCAWVFMILKPYNWERTLTNTKPIVLVKTSQKILSKILFNRISVACSDNFLVLKDTSTQTPIFAIGLIVKDALEKNRELWLTYDSVEWFYLHNSLVRIKMFMTDFRLTDGYVIHDGLDQGEVFSPLFNSMTATQNILDIASEFFGINDISININKMVTILINMRVENPQLFISGAAISIAKKKELHRYLDIFLSTDGLSIPNLAKVHSDPIVSYRIQFSYVLACVCEKWDGLFRKGLKIKTSLPKDFPNETLYHSEMYGLKFFSQLQAKNLLASVIGFANSGGVLGRFFPVKLSINPINCFLASITNTLVLCGFSLVNNISNVFQSGVGVPVADVLGVVQYLSMIVSLRKFGIVFVNQLLDHNNIGSLAGVGALVHHFVSDIHLCNFGFANSHLVEKGPGVVSVYTDGSVKGLGSAGTCGGATAYFSDIDLSVEIRIYGRPISGNTRQFIWCLFNAVNFVGWESKYMSGIVDLNLVEQFDMRQIFQVWHPNSSICSGFSSSVIAMLRSYFMKALHYRLPMAV
ncbi:hypothetical protein G9A89_001664 [Geosiphon pyriformis]|nr:hypothetical protein G9A89_001664 [Geosiphon pyriformis]